MRTLSTLIKLQKSRVDEQRLMLAMLQQRLDDIEKAVRDHEERKVLEQKAVQKNPETGLTYGAFVKWAIKRTRELEMQRIVASKAVDMARDNLAAVFEEQKRYELAEEARLEAERQEELRRETLELDEIGGVAHERRKRQG